VELAAVDGDRSRTRRPARRLELRKTDGDELAGSKEKARWWQGAEVRRRTRGRCDVEETPSLAAARPVRSGPGRNGRTLLRHEAKSQRPQCVSAVEESVSTKSIADGGWTGSAVHAGCGRHAPSGPCVVTIVSVWYERIAGSSQSNRLGSSSSSQPSRTTTCGTGPSRRTSPAEAAHHRGPSANQ